MKEDAELPGAMLEITPRRDQGWGAGSGRRRSDSNPDSLCLTHVCSRACRQLDAGWGAASPAGLTPALERPQLYYPEACNRHI